MIALAISAAIALNTPPTELDELADELDRRADQKLDGSEDNGRQP